jgi:hypothetical protein
MLIETPGERLLLMAVDASQRSDEFARNCERRCARYAGIALSRCIFFPGTQGFGQPDAFLIIVEVRLAARSDDPICTFCTFRTFLHHRRVSRIRLLNQGDRK